jgi:hypothetical protein
MPLQFVVRQIDKVNDIETHIDNLMRQKDILQKIEDYSSERCDFADIIETYELLTAEIERLQEYLKAEKQKCLPVPGKEGCGKETGGE